MVNFSTKTKLRIARTLSSTLCSTLSLAGKNPSSISARRAGINWSLDLREGIDLSLFLIGYFERSASIALRDFLKPGMTAIDVGANIGAHTLHMAQSVGNNGRVVAVEPTSWAFQKLTKNIFLNRNLAEIITAQQVFLGDNKNSLPAEIASSWSLSESSEKIHPIHGGVGKELDGATLSTLDKLVEDLALPSVDLIKIDVDGFESQVLSGGAKTLSSLRPILLVELCSYVHQENGSSFETFLEILWHHGYELFSIRSNHPLPKSVERLEELIPRSGGINAWAFPSGTRNV